jgi:hypothetical protein
MPDITMCIQKDCKIRKLCYRYTAKPDRLQSFFAADPRNGDPYFARWPTEYCEYFWDNKDEDNQEPDDLASHPHYNRLGD